MVREHSSHDRDEATVNDHQRDLDAHNDPCAFRISNTDWTLRRIAFPLSAILDCSEIRSTTSYVWFNLVMTNFYSLVPVIFIPVTYSHAAQLYGWNLTEWALSIYPSHGLTNPALVTILLNISPRNTQDTTVMTRIFQSGGGM